LEPLEPQLPSRLAVRQWREGEHWEERLPELGSGAGVPLIARVPWGEANALRWLDESSRWQTRDEKGEVLKWYRMGLDVHDQRQAERADASALTAIRASVPFDPPPRMITVTIPVDFHKYD
jgi:hypothetical protein